MSKIKLLVAFVIVTFAFSSGAYVCNLQWAKKHNALLRELDKAKIENMSAVLEVERLQRDTANAIAEKLAAEKLVQDAKAKVITKEVIRYVETNVNANAVVDADFVRIHDAAVSVPGTTEATTGTDDTPGQPATVGCVLETVVDNYAICQDAIARLKAWQDWCKGVGCD